MCVYHIHADATKGQKTELDLLELESESTLWMIGTESMRSARAARALSGELCLQPLEGTLNHSFL